MKLQKILTGSAAALLALSLAAVPAAAAEVGSTSTVGDVTFKGADTDTPGGNPSTPGDDKKDDFITPDEEDKGSSTTGPLRIEYVPNLHFGEQTISTKNEEYNSLWNQGTVAGGTDMQNIPIFAQVRDETGSKTNSWKLTVQQTSLFAAAASEGVDPLENTRVRIYAATPYNSLYNLSNKDKPAGQEVSKKAAIPTALSSAITTDGYKTIPGPSDPDGALEILNGTDTNGSDSSVVFSDTTQYDPNSATDPYTVHEDQDNPGNTGLKLFVPGTDVAYATGYTANFTWTLSNSL